MNYENYTKQPMQMVEVNLNMIISTNPHLIISLDGSFIHHQPRQKNNIPLKIQ